MVKKKKRCVFIVGGEGIPGEEYCECCDHKGVQLGSPCPNGCAAVIEENYLPAYRYGGTSLICRTCGWSCF